MGKTPRKKKLSESGISRNGESSSSNSRCNSRSSRCSGEHTPKAAVDEDDAVFVGLAMELKEEGTRLFQRRDYEGAAFRFDKATKLLPKEHDDIAFLHCSAAACYMHTSPEEYHRAIDACNLALEAAPTYANALLKRARCFEALGRLDLACRDVQKVLSLEPNNVSALELAECIREEMEEEEVLLDKVQAVSPEEPKAILPKEKIKRKVSRKFRNSIVEEEVWEMIHDEEMPENDEDCKEEKSNEDSQMGNALNKEENVTEDICLQLRIKQSRDKDGKRSEDIQAKHGQCERRSSDEGRDMEETTHLKQKHDRDRREEKHFEEIQVRGGHQHEQEMHTKQQGQMCSVEKRQKDTEEIQITVHSKQEKHPEEKHENHTNGNLEKHSSQRHIGRGEDNQEKRSAATKPASHGRDRHQEHSHGENLTADASKGTTSVKFVLGDDIRFVVIPENCSLTQLTDIARFKYSPHLKAALLKFKDREGDLVTITSSEELRWVEELNPKGPVRLYIKEVSPELEITRDLVMPAASTALAASERMNHHRSIVSERGISSRPDVEKNCAYVDDWMVQFARLFKNHVGFDSDAYVDLRDLGMRLCYEAMEDAIASEEAQEMFQAAEAKFQEMAALALFNWGNVHTSRARKRLLLPEDSSKESVLSQVRDAYQWACAEYAKAGKKFEEAVDLKPDFYEGLIALGHQQFEQAKLSWRYADSCEAADMGAQVLELFNHAEDNMEKGMEMWEGTEYLRVRGLSKSKKEKTLLDNLGLNGHVEDLSADEAFEQASNMRSQLNISWGTILYERSVVEFKLGLASWEESLAESIEKFKTGGASLADISVMIKNHCANEKTQEGLSFKIDEIVQAWNEMYDAKKLKNGGSSFRLEPLFRRRPSKLHNLLEHIHCT